MDSDAALAEILDKCTELLASESVPEGQTDQEWLYSLALELSQQVKDLDHCIVNSDDRLPKRWKKASPWSPSIQKYIEENSVQCPFCGRDSFGLQYGSPDTVGSKVEVPVFCRDCEQEWVDIYALTAVRKIK